MDVPTGILIASDADISNVTTGKPLPNFIPPKITKLLSNVDKPETSKVDSIVVAPETSNVVPKRIPPDNSMLPPNSKFLLISTFSLKENVSADNPPNTILVLASIPLVVAYAIAY